MTNETAPEAGREAPDVRAGRGDQSGDARHHGAGHRRGPCKVFWVGDRHYDRVSAELCLLCARKNGGGSG